MQSDSLDDRASGAGPPASPLQGDVDLAEAPGSCVYNEPTFDAHVFESSLIDDRIVSSRDSWISSLIGKRFKCKELEFEDDLEFKQRRPSSLFSTIMRRLLKLILAPHFPHNLNYALNFQS